MRKFRITEIEWQTDNENVDLPIALEIDVPDHISDNMELTEFLSDEISNVTGFLHEGYCSEEIKI